MTDDVGYKRPPKEHRFKKGFSGNPRGRPPKKERALTTRQVRRDILDVLEETITLSVGGVPTKIPAIVAILMMARRKALSGHGPMIRFCNSLHGDAVAAHEEVHNDRFELLEQIETYASAEGVESDPAMRAELNRLRKLTRKV